MTPTQITLQAIEGRTDLIVATTDTLLTLLRDAAEELQARLLKLPTDYQRWYLPAVAAEVRTAMDTLGGELGAVVSTATGTLWQAGEVLVDDVVRAGGFSAVAPRIDQAQLVAMRAFATERMSGISLEAANSINLELGRVIIGGQTPFDAVKAVASILEEKTFGRASTAVNTNLAQAHSTATQLRMEQLEADVPGLQKKWIKSGKRDPRIWHAVIDGQTQPVGKPFLLRGGAVKMMYPHDPAAPAGEVINCGCISVPVVPERS